MDFRFYLDELEIEEPRGWGDFQLSMKRDEKYHGMQFEAGVGTLEFFGNAIPYLQAAKALNGIKANVILKSEIACEGGDYEQVYRGRLNFGRYKESCGTTCTISLPAEEESCRVIFKSRFDQKVDLDSTTAFDKITGLSNYTQIGQEITIPAKALQAQIEGYVIEGGDEIVIEPQVTVDGKVIVRPSYADERYNSIQTGQLLPFGNYQSEDDEFAQPISPQLLYEDNLKCFNEDLEYEFRLKGSFTVDSTSGGDDVTSVKLKVVSWDAIGNIFDDAVILHETTLPYSGGVPVTGTFDQTYSGTLVPVEGATLYGFIEYDLDPSLIGFYTITTTFDPETYVNISAVKKCPPTQSEVYLIHETLSRVTEAITNRCIRVKSAYYGRIDSQPFAFDEDGCGSLRLLTSGLKLRRAPEDEDKFFASAKELIEGLYAIDNIGFSVDEDDTLPGFYVLRIEPVEYFYQDRELISFDFIPEGDIEVQESMHYSKVLAGYKKWKVEQVNGLGEPNSEREYRTSLDTISNPLDIQSNIVTGSYPIEITRQQSFADTGAADTTYDNDIFLICLTRNAYDFEVEQGGISNDANIFDPGTLLNFRITPVRNLMRWFKSIVNSYVSLGGTDKKLFFSSGTGNITASGLLTEPICRLEAAAIAENQDLWVNSFSNVSDATPLWRPETVSFEYPLSVADYLSLKSDPYGYISYQCGTGSFANGFIKEIRFNVAKGTASFTLIKKW